MDQHCSPLDAKRLGAPGNGYMRFAEFNVIMLLTDGFGGFGGISQFNKDFLTALDRSKIVTRTFAFPRLIRHTIREEIPESVVYFRAAAAGKFSYFHQVMRGLNLSSNIDLVVCGHIHLLPLAFLASQTKRARLALIVHGIEAWHPTRHPIANRIASRVDTVIAMSRLSAERFQEWSDVPTDRIFVLGNSIDLDRFTPLPRDPLLAARYGLEGARVIMTLGRLSKSERYKGVDEIIDIIPSLLAEIPNLKYLVVGDGDDSGRLREKADGLKLSKNVIFAREISEAEKIAHYSLADAFVMPSSGEGFGIVLLEAAACGVPVIGSAIDGSREALLGGALGMLVDPHNPDALRQAILETLRTRLSKRRPQGLETFATPSFQAKLGYWLETQAKPAATLAA
jgi:phosphatidyl-myo-inositol dimannoside synthase